MAEYRGVFFRTERGAWRAKVYYHDRSIWIGSFDSALDAAWAYDTAAQFLHGPNAKLNFPGEVAPLHIRASVASVLLKHKLIQ